MKQQGGNALLDRGSQIFSRFPSARDALKHLKQRCAVQRQSYWWENGVFSRRALFTGPGTDRGDLTRGEHIILYRHQGYHNLSPAMPFLETPENLTNGEQKKNAPESTLR